MSKTIVYTTPYVFKNEHEILRNGAVVVQSGRVLDVGLQQQIITTWDPAQIIKCSGILLPALINCHTHLELSHLTDISAPAPESGMADWIEEVLHHRQQQKISAQAVIAKYTDALRQQNRTGVALLADITNTIDDGLPQYCGYTEVCQIVEMIAPTSHRTIETLQNLESLPKTLQVSPHSPYSTSAHLIKILKKRARKNNQIFSIHLAESVAELELLKFQKGDFRQLLERRDSWDGNLLDNISTTGAVHYLNSLDVLDEKTLCVHCVHVSEEEIAILAEQQVKICVCPGSNSYLGVGDVPLENILQAGILPGIGTDSIASNKRLDMWREMQILRQKFPDIPAEKIFAMATQGGAKSLHRESDYGTVEKGKKAIFLEVVLDDIEKLSGTDIIELLTSGGMPEKLSWISPAQKI